MRERDASELTAKHIEQKLLAAQTRVSAFSEVEQRAEQLAIQLNEVGGHRPQNCVYTNL